MLVSSCHPWSRGRRRGGSRRRAPGGAGFTLVGLLVSVASIGLCAFLAAPIYMRARETATLRSTMADMSMWSESISAYISDFGEAPSNPNGKMHYKKTILRDLLPYLRQVRIMDWWCNAYWIWTGTGIDEYGVTTTGPREFIVASVGKKGMREDWRYDPLKPGDGLFRAATLRDFENDLVLWNGNFLRCPGSL